MFHSGDSIGPYTLVRALGAGAHCEAWLAAHESPQEDTQVALKFPRDPNFDIEALRTEAERWRRAAGHPNMISVLDAEVYDGQVVIAYEYAADGSLHDLLLRNGGAAPSAESAIEMTQGILAGLGRLHSNGILHHNLKPDNVLLQSATPRITDYGLARLCAISDRSSSLIGSPHYMPPEAFKGSYSAASDLWSAAVILYQLLSGALPYELPDIYSLIAAITSDEPVRVPAGIPEDLHSFFARALSKEPCERFASAEEMAAALARPIQASAASVRPLAPARSVSQARPRSDSTLPTGTITFLFTDIEGSSRLWQEAPEAMRTALSRHDALVRAAIDEQGGHVFKTVGDGFYGAFGSASDAVCASLYAQLALSTEPWPEGVSIRVRMALHTGDAELRNGDYFGPSLTRVSRLLECCHGGQILLSEAVQELTRDSLPEGADSKCLGTHRLRDTIGPEAIYQLQHADLQSDFQGLRGVSSLESLHNLPRHVTSFIGRKAQIAEIVSLLDRNRLVTLTGIGGCGKSRLALQAAEEVLPNFSDGVWLVELASLTDGGLVAQAVAAALGIPEQPIQNLTDTLLEHLRPKKALILLDNCEHLIRDCAVLADSLLEACPQLAILATSRDPISIHGEQLCDILPMSLPDPSENTSVDQLQEYEAVSLFCARARAVDSHFSLTALNAGIVAQICARLDGLPLLIELVAAQVRSLTVDEIADDLYGLLKELEGPVTEPLRHRTVEALLNWSYDLLTEREKTLFRRLSVFVGGWTLDAAQAIYADDRTLGRQVRPILLRLVRSSLVKSNKTGERTRYDLLETVRQFASERLAQSGETVQVSALHTDYYLALVEETEAQMQQAPQQEPLSRAALDQLDMDYANVRAVLSKPIGSPDDAERNMRIAGSLAAYWCMRGYLSEGRRCIDSILQAAPSAPPRVRSKALNGAGILAWIQRDLVRAESLHKECLAIREELGDLRDIAVSQNNLSLIAHEQNDYGTMEGYLQTTLDLFTRIRDDYGISTTRGNFGALAIERGEFAAAKSHLQEALALIRKPNAFSRLKAAEHECRLLNLLASAHDGEQEYDLALKHYAECLRIQKDLNLRSSVGTSLSGIAAVDIRRGRWERAVVLAAGIEAFCCNLGVPNPLESEDAAADLAREMRNRPELVQLSLRGRALQLSDLIDLALQPQPAQPDR